MPLCNPPWPRGPGPSLHALSPFHKQLPSLPAATNCPNPPDPPPAATRIRWGFLSSCRLPQPLSEPLPAQTSNRGAEQRRQRYNCRISTGDFRTSHRHHDFYCLLAQNTPSHSNEGNNHGNQQPLAAVPEERPARHSAPDGSNLH